MLSASHSAQSYNIIIVISDNSSSNLNNQFKRLIISEIKTVDKIAPSISYWRVLSPWLSAVNISALKLKG